MVMLLYDDVVDEFELCCGCQIVNVLFGNVVSVLVGDYFYLCLFEMMVGVGKMCVMEILFEVMMIILEGEVLQFLNMYDVDVDEMCYMQVICYKMVKLFEVLVCLGVVFVGVDVLIEVVVVEYGCWVGIVFQIMDDWFDYVGIVEVMGKNVGDDLCEGKLMLLFIYLIECGMFEQLVFVCEVIEQGGIDCFDMIFEVIMCLGVFDYMFECVCQEVQVVVVVIVVFFDLIYKESLFGLCLYLMLWQL